MLICTLIFYIVLLFSSMEERIWDENDYYLSQVRTEIYRLLSGPLIVYVSHEQISSPSLVCKQNSLHLRSSCLSILFKTTIVGIFNFANCRNEAWW